MRQYRNKLSQFSKFSLLLGATLCGLLTPNLGLSQTLNGFGITPSAVKGGTIATGTITLNKAAPAGGVTIALSSDRLAASTPPSVVIPSGQTATTFNISSTAVTADTVATLTATQGKISRLARVAVTASELKSVAIIPDVVVGGSKAIARVSLDGIAPVGGITVALSSANSLVVLPATVSITAGTDSSDVSISTSTVPLETNVTVTAKLGKVTHVANLKLLAPALQSITISPSSVKGGSPTTGKITLTGPASTKGLNVNLSSANNAATVPATISIGAGNESGTFNIVTTPVATDTEALIVAKEGTIVRQVNVRIAAPLLHSVVLNPPSVKGGSTSAGTITLDGPAASGGVAVTLTSNKKSATVPANVTVGPGKTTATFTVTTLSVPNETDAILTATTNKITRTATLAVLPAQLASITLTVSTIKGGTSTSGVITLDGPAPDGGAVVSLNSNRAQATVPETVTILPGTTSRTFAIGTFPVEANYKVTISAKYQGLTKATTLTLTK